MTDYGRCEIYLKFYRKLFKILQHFRKFTVKIIIIIISSSSSSSSSSTVEFSLGGSNPYTSNKQE